MKTVRGSKKRRLGGLIVALLGLTGAIYLGAGARNAVLDAAVRQARIELAPVLAAPATGNPQAVVHRLVTTNASDLVFLTVRNDQDQLVASAGAWSGWFSGMAPRATVRTWRAWMYRTLCADSYRSIPGGAKAHAGVPWWRVLASAGPAFWLTLLLSISGLIVCGRERRAPVAASETATAGWRERLPRTHRRGRHDTRRPALDRAARSNGFQAIGAHRGSQAADGPGSPPDQADDGAAQNARPGSPGPAVDPIGPDARATSTDDDPDTANRRPPFGRLVLCCQPVWRGAMDGLLAGAAVCLLYAAEPNARPFSIAELMTGNAGGPDDAGTSAAWLARQLATLLTHWHTLELPPVPLMVPVPGRLLQFERAGDVWGEAFSEPGHAARDLIFCVERMPQGSARALPVRWAVAEVPGQHGRGWYCLQSGMDVEPSKRHSGDAAALAGGEPAPFLIPHGHEESVDKAQRALSPRAFARLINQYERAPL